jgi:hypothetical protein
MRLSEGGSLRAHCRWLDRSLGDLGVVERIGGVAKHLDCRLDVGHNAFRTEGQRTGRPCTASITDSDPRVAADSYAGRPKPNDDDATSGLAIKEPKEVSAPSPGPTGS